MCPASAIGRGRNAGAGVRISIWIEIRLCKEQSEDETRVGPVYNRQIHVRWRYFDLTSNLSEWFLSKIQRIRVRAKESTNNFFSFELAKELYRRENIWMELIKQKVLMEL